MPINVNYIWILLITIIFEIISAQTTNSDSLENGIKIFINASNAITNTHIVYYNEFVLPTNSISIVTISQLQSLPIGFGIIQTHSCFHNVTLSYSPTIKKGFYQYGSDLGLILYPNDTKDTNVYIHNHHHVNTINVSVALTVYNRTAPVPGACNLEYESSIEAPILVLNTSDSNLIVVDTPPGGQLISDDLKNVSNPIVCNDIDLDYLGYVYTLRSGDFSCRNYFDGIKTMLTPDAIAFTTDSYMSKSWPELMNRQSYIAIPGTGMIFTTILSNEFGSSAYVPAYTISCRPLFWDHGCNMYNTPEFHVLALMLLFIGIVRGFLGVVLNTFSTFIDGCVTGMFITFFMIHFLSDWIEMTQGTETIMIAIGGIILGTILIIIAFKLPRFMFVIIICNSIILGYLLSAINLHILDNMGITLPSYVEQLIQAFSSMIIFLVSIAPCCQIMPLIINAIWSTATIVQSLLIINNNNAALIMINPLRRMTVANYRLAHTAPKLYDSDIFYLLLWIGLIVLAVRIQLILLQQHEHSGGINASANANASGSGVGGVVGENQPLISRWTHGSDNVFETPRSNQRFITSYRRLRTQPFVQ